MQPSLKILFSMVLFVLLKFIYADAYANLLRDENIVRLLKSTTEVVPQKLKPATSTTFLILGIFLHSPALTSIIYVALTLMQEWNILLKEEDREKLVQVKDGIMSWMKKFKPSCVAPTDVIEFLFECLASCLYDTLKLAFLKAEFILLKK